MLAFFDYILPICGVVAILILIAVIYANRRVLFTDYGLESEQAEIKRLNAKNKELQSTIDSKNKTIVELLNKLNQK